MMPKQLQPTPKLEILAMPQQLHQTLKLETLAVNKITGWITIHTKDHMIAIDEALLSHQIETLQAYFKNTPGKLLSSLLSKLMEDLANLLMTRYPYEVWPELTGPIKETCVTDKIIEVLFNSNLHALTLNSSEIDVFGATFSSKSHLLTGLNSLKLCIKISILDYSDESIEASIFSILKPLCGLKSLTVTCCSDKLLQFIVNNCKLIEHIEIHNYYYAKLESILMLDQLPNLERVSLHENTNDFMEDPSEIERRKSKILEHISLRKQFDIESFVVCNETFIEDLELVLEKYLIQSLEFIKIKRDSMKRYMESVSNLQDYVELKIVEYDFYKDNVKEFIQLVGKKIQKLHLVEVKNIDQLACKTIGLACPLLESLSLLRTHLFVSDHILYDAENPLFKNLKNISIHIYPKDYKSVYPSRPFPEQLVSFYILINSPNVEVIDINNIEFTKDFIIQVLNENPLKCLRELRMPKKLHIQVINSIKENGITPNVAYYYMPIRL